MKPSDPVTATRSCMGVSSHPWDPGRFGPPVSAGSVGMAHRSPEHEGGVAGEHDEQFGARYDLAEHPEAAVEDLEGERERAGDQREGAAAEGLQQQGEEQRTAEQ